ncbi:MAG TPA: BrnT family toxin [Candidatus Nanoarchaeia archaeon]
MRIDKQTLRFEWDKGNIGKSKKHGVSDQETEEVFFDSGKVSFKDLVHSDTEERFILLGKTSKERLLYIVFTKREDRIRIISARDVNKKERPLYEKTT